MKVKKRWIMIPSILILFLIITVGATVLIEREKLRKTIEEDEAEYGNQYQKLNYLNYKEKPDRIIYKPKEKDKFYVFSGKETEFEHLLEVAEDRMHYSMVEDYNMTAFKTDSIDRILSSGQNYIIFDYDIEKYDNTNNGETRPIVFKLKDNNRCYRLFSYVTQFRKSYSPESLTKMLRKKGFSITDVEANQEKEQQAEAEGYKLLYTADDLQKIIANPSGKYRLANDIDLKGYAFSLNNTFSGELDGNGHTIKNKKITDENSTAISFIQNNQGTIKNLTLEAVEVALTKKISYAGLVATTNTGIIENCKVSGNITIQTQDEMTDDIAGICGIMNQGSIKNCTNQVNIKNGRAGICAIVNGGTIEGCINEGKIEGTWAYGICNSNLTEIKDCVNKGKIIGRYVATGIVYYVRGDITNCRNEGNVKALEKGTASGIAVQMMQATTKVENCSNSGTIQAGNLVAGIIANNGDCNGPIGNILNCQNTGKLQLDNSGDENGIKYIGGIAGNHVVGSINNCNNTGIIAIQTKKGTIYQGDLAGAKSSKATIDKNNTYGKNYDFQTFYDENWSLTYND